MSEQTPSPYDSTRGDGASPVDASTGVPVVDEVVADLDVLDDLPVGEHLPVLESAHERLRSALSDVGETDPQP